MGEQKPRDYSKQGFTTYYKKNAKSSRSEAKALAWYSYEEESVYGVSRRLCICLLSLSADPLLVLTSWPDPTHIHTVIYTNLHTKYLSFSHKNTLHETRHRIWQWALPCSPTWNRGLPCIWNLTSQEWYFLYQEGSPFGWWSHVAIRPALHFFESEMHGKAYLPWWDTPSPQHWVWQDSGSVPSICLKCTLLGEN